MCKKKKTHYYHFCIICPVVLNMSNIHNVNEYLPHFLFLVVLICHIKRIFNICQR